MGLIVGFIIFFGAIALANAIGFFVKRYLYEQSLKKVLQNNKD